MIVHLLDGTYELFRAFFAAPSARSADGQEIGAVRVLLRSLVPFLANKEVTHVAVAFDTVISSFRNQLFAGYKTGEGVDPELLAQFALAEELTRALGVVTWSMIDFEADDALATFALRAEADPRVTQVRIATPDKDLCQCVRGSRVVLLDRKSGETTDEAGVMRRLGVVPARVPSFLGLVGDTADGIPGIPRWGAKAAAAALARYASVAAIPDDASAWEVSVRGAKSLATELAGRREDALLYERLATLRTDVPLAESVDHLRWRGPEVSALRPLGELLRASDAVDRLCALPVAPTA